MVQRGLKEGILVTWTKSFACPDGYGEDAVRLLEEAIARKGVNMLDDYSSLNLQHFISGITCTQS